MNRLLIVPLVALLLMAGACSSGPKSPSASSATSSSTVAGATTSAGPSTSSGPTTTAVPPTGSIVDSTWISDTVGWVLGSGPSIRHTTDGGQTWSSDTAPSGSYRGLRFANASVGYAFGGESDGGADSADFAMTTDGGRTWHHSSGQLVLRLEVSGATVYRLVATDTGCPGPCKVSMQSASVGASTWHALDAAATAGDRGFGDDLQLNGPDIYFVGYGHIAGGAGDAHAAFARSTDGGASWSSFDDPCGSGPEGEDDANHVAAAPNGVLVVECVARAGQTAAFVLVSTDSGAHFGPRRPLPDAGALGLAAASASSLVVPDTFASGNASVFGALVSHDGGVTWSRTLDNAGTVAPGTNPTAFIGFEDPHTARVSFGGPSIWTTTDAATTWTRGDPYRQA